MKCAKKFTLLVILIGIWHNIYTFGADAPSISCVGERLLDLFTKWRHGDELPFPLPPLEVIDVQSFDGNYTGFGIQITFTTGEMRLRGMDNFTVEELLASANETLKASGTVHFPLLFLSADNYNLQGRAYVFYSLKGSGSMLVTFRNVKLMFGIKVVPDGEGTRIKDIQLNFSVEGIQINLEGSSWPINKVLNTEAITIIDGYHSFLVDTAMQGVTRSLNNYLTTVTPEKMSDTFVGNCNEETINDNKL